MFIYIKCVKKIKALFEHEIYLKNEYFLSILHVADQNCTSKKLYHLKEGLVLIPVNVTASHLTNAMPAWYYVNAMDAGTHKIRKAYIMLNAQFAILIHISKYLIPN